MITASVATLSGGASNEVSVMKGERIGQIIMENRLPSIQLLQTVNGLGNPSFCTYCTKELILALKSARSNTIRYSYITLHQRLLQSGRR